MRVLRTLALTFSAAVACASLSVAALAANTAPFPRLAGVNIGSPQNYEDPAYQRKLARLDAVVLNYWVGWESGRGTTMEQVVRNIKAINPNTKVFLYINNNELVDGSNDAWSDVRAKLDANNWWLYQNGGSGTRTKSTFGTSHFLINNTPYAPADSSGQRLVDWFAQWYVDKYYKPNPSIDGFFTDNVFWRPRADGDWNRDGSRDSVKDASVRSWLRQGYKQHYAALNKLMPGKPQIGNVADWGEPDSSLSEYSGIMQGGILESMIGQSYSVESWASWTDVNNWYRKTMNSLADPKIGIFHQDGDPTDYQAFRYGFTTCLMGDGYYAFNDIKQGYRDVFWFDEFDAKLGAATTAPPTAAWSNGVWRRDFENGIALVNPKGNGPVTVELETDFVRLTGAQAPGVNTGTATRSVRLAERDGIILKRIAPQARPPAPRNLRVL